MKKGMQLIFLIVFVGIGSTNVHCQLTTFRQYTSNYTHDASDHTHISMTTDSNFAKSPLVTTISRNTTAKTNVNLLHESFAVNESTTKQEQPKEDKLKSIYETLEYVQDMYILPVVCTTGIIGNGLVASFLYERRGTNSSFIYMFALLLADLLSLVSDLFLPVSTLIAKSNSNSVRETATNLYFWNKNFITYVLRGTAFNILCVLSMERFMAIKYPLKLKTSLTVKKPQIFLFVSFVIAVCTNIQVPLFTEIAGVTDEMTNKTSYKRIYSDLYFVDKERSDNIVLFLHFFAGPVQIVFFCVMNILIVHGIYENRRQLLAMNMNNTDRLRTIKNLQVKLCKIFLVLCFTNILAFLPNSVTTIVAKLFPELGMSIRDYSTQLLLHGGNLLRVLNSMSDFIVMMAMSNEIRRDVKQRCACQRPQDKYLQKEKMSRSSNNTENKTDISMVSGMSFKRR